MGDHFLCSLASSLIYTVAVGEPYRALAGLMVRSLHRFSFKAEVAVLCDEPLNISSDLMNQIIIPPGKLSDLDMAGQNVVHLRTVADRFIPGLFDHNYILHIDADVLCTGSLDAIFLDPNVTSRVGVQAYPRPLCAAGQDFTAADWRRCASRNAQERAPGRPVRGIVGFPGGRLGTIFCGFGRSKPPPGGETINPR